MSNLTNKEIYILKTIMEKSDRNDAKILKAAIDGIIEINNIQRLCELINEEFLMEGIREDFEPNEYGKEIAAILNKINAPRLL